MRSLIIYYSRNGENYLNGDIVSLKVGNTEKIAKLIQKKFNSDMFKVVQKYPYSNDYSTCIAQANEDKKKGIRPALESYIDDISIYDVIFIGYPNYWSDIPMAMLGLLEKLDFKNKKILPFCTHEGSGLGNSIHTLYEACTGAEIGIPFETYGHRVYKNSENIEKRLETFYKENNLI